MYSDSDYPEVFKGRAAEWEMTGQILPKSYDCQPPVATSASKGQTEQTSLLLTPNMPLR